MRFTSVEPHSEPTQPQKIQLRDDASFASNKIASFQYAAVAIFLFLITGFWELQIKSPEIYNERAERNRIKALPIVAPRGKILDRDGRVIVDNHSSWSLILSRENLRTEHLREIADGLHLDYDDLMLKVARYKKRPKYEPIIIKEELTPADLAFVESHRDPETFPEMETILSQRRLYPQNGVLAHVIGYTGEISEPRTRPARIRKIQPGTDHRQDRHREGIQRHSHGCRWRTPVGGGQPRAGARGAWH